MLIYQGRAPSAARDVTAVRVSTACRSDVTSSKSHGVTSRALTPVSPSDVTAGASHWTGKALRAQAAESDDKDKESSGPAVPADAACSDARRPRAQDRLDSSSRY